MRNKPVPKEKIYREGSIIRPNPDFNEGDSRVFIIHEMKKNNQLLVMRQLGVPEEEIDEVELSSMQLDAFLEFGAWILESH